MALTLSRAKNRCMAGPAPPRDPSPDALFARFRERGDPAALAALFDATADGLYGLALTLLPDPATAEDAVQETFLAALEHADRHDGARPVVPWLVGILRHKAEALRRGARRRPDPWRLPVPDPEEDAPATEAARREREARVHAALEALPEPLRLPALLRWKHGLEPAEIAHLLGRRPGTVRMALSRALERLRRRLGRLPAMLLAGGVRPPRGLDAVRRAVAGEAAAAATAAGAGAALAAGGILVGKKTAVAAVLLFLLGGGAWWWTGGGGGKPADRASTGTAPVFLHVSTPVRPAPSPPGISIAEPAGVPAPPAPPPAPRGNRTVRWPVVAGECPVPPDGTAIPLRARPGANAAEKDPPAGRMVGGELVVEGLPEENWWGAEALGPEGSMAFLFVPTGEGTGREASFFKGRRIEVILKEEDGTAVAGAWVEARESGNNRMGPAASTDQDGRAWLLSLPPLRASVLMAASAEPMSPSLPLGTVDLTVGDGRLEAVLKPTVGLDVRITVDGKPELPEGLTLMVQGAMVVSRTNDAAASMVRMKIRSASRDPLVRVYAGGPGLLAANAASERGEGGGGLVVDLAMQRSAGTLVAHITPPKDGRFQWQLRRLDGEGGPRPTHGSNFRNADGSGAFGPPENMRLEGLAPGRYRILTDSGIASEEVELVRGRTPPEVHLDLSQVVAATGRIEAPDATDFRAVHVVVEGEGLGPQTHGGLFLAGGGLFSGTGPGLPARSDGTFHVRIPGDRPVRLRPWHPSLVPDPAGGVVDVEGAAEGVVLRLVEGPHALFTLDPVRKEEYRSRTEVRLFRGEPAGEPVSVHQAEEVGGRFRIGGFPPDVYTLWIDAPGSAPKFLRGVRFLGGENDLGVIPMEEGASVRVHLTLAEGAAPPNLFVNAMALDGPRHFRGLNYLGKGEVVLPGLGKGRYRVSGAPGGDPGTVLLLRTVESSGSGEIPLELDLR